MRRVSRHIRRKHFEEEAPPGWSNTKSLEMNGSDERLSQQNPSFDNWTKSGGKTLATMFKWDNDLTGNGSRKIFRCDDASTSTYNGFWDFRIWRHSSFTGGNQRISLQRRVDNGSTFSPATSIYGTINITAGNWYHLAVVSTGTQHRFYVDGVADTFTSTGDGDWWYDCLIPSTPINFWVMSNGVTVYTAGHIDELILADADFGTGDISNLTDGSVIPIDPSTHSRYADITNYWRMGEDDSDGNPQDDIGTDHWTGQNIDVSNYSTDVAA